MQKYVHFYTRKPMVGTGSRDSPANFENASPFYPRDAMLARVIEIATCLSVRPSVCPSVRPSRACIV